MSFFCRIHMTLLNFSGSSVANGVMSREMTSGGHADSFRRWWSVRVTNRSAPKMMAASATMICRITRLSSGDSAVRWK